MEEKFITINLRKQVIKSPSWRRTERFIRLLKKKLQREFHTKRIVIEKEVNEKIWSRGGKNPPTKLKLRLKKQEDGSLSVSLA